MQRFEGKLAATCRQHQADSTADRKLQAQRQHRTEAARQVQENMQASQQLAQEYPHGLTRGQLKRLQDQGILESPGHLGYGSPSSTCYYKPFLSKT